VPPLVEVSFLRVLKSFMCRVTVVSCKSNASAIDAIDQSFAYKRTALIRSHSRLSRHFLWRDISASFWSAVREIFFMA
jgi:hypothetical protein